MLIDSKACLELSFKMLSDIGFEKLAELAILLKDSFIFIYTRTSKTSTTPTSTKRQKNACLRVLAHLNITAMKTYSDHVNCEVALSQRPGFNAMLKGIKLAVMKTNALEGKDKEFTITTNQTISADAAFNEASYKTQPTKFTVISQTIDCYGRNLAVLTELASIATTYKINFTAVHTPGIMEILQDTDVLKVVSKILLDEKEAVIARHLQNRFVAKAIMKKKGCLTLQGEGKVGGRKPLSEIRPEVVDVIKELRTLSSSQIRRELKHRNLILNPDGTAVSLATITKYVKKLKEK